MKANRKSKERGDSPRSTALLYRDPLDQCRKENAWEMTVSNSPDDATSAGLGNKYVAASTPDKTQPDISNTDIPYELFVSGLVPAVAGGEVGVEIRRGMTILTTEGEMVGTVAGVIKDTEPQEVKYILLSRPSQYIEYRMVPVELIQQISEETVSLHILAALVNTLPPWHK
jgi:hypothetical protein